MVYEQSCGGTTAGERHAHAKTALGRRSSQFRRNRVRVTEETRYSTEIHDDLASVARHRGHGNPRRKLARHGHERLVRTALRRIHRTKEMAVHIACQASSA